MSEFSISVDRILDTVFSHGTFWVYLIICIGCFIENLLPPFPGDAFILAAGALSAAGRLEPITAGIAALIGGMLSVFILYFIGKKYGREYFIRKNFRFFNAQDIHNTEQKFEKWGALILIVSRFLFGIRSAVSVTAGIVDYPRFQMLLFSAISYAIFITLWMLLASGVVAGISDLPTMITNYGKIIGLIIVVAVIIYFFRNWFESKQEK
jgi:membrane protein DedA with SNARE-associated domain